MADMMTFPDTVEEFMEEYKLVDAEQVYTNGTELVPIFRMKQWFEHEKEQLSRQGTTSDLISRQAAIDALDTGLWGVEWDKALATAMLKDLPPVQPEPTDINAKEAVYNLAEKIGIHQLFALTVELRGEPIQAEPQWIPVSERLPEDMQFVLLTVRRLKAEYNHEPFISVGYIGWNQTHWWCAHDGDCEISKIEVIAWMPLPEPYKPNNK